MLDRVLMACGIAGCHRFLPSALFSLRRLKLGMVRVKLAALGTHAACSPHKYTHAHQLEFHA